MSSKQIGILVFVLIMLVLLYNTLFIVRETQNAVILELGRPKKEIRSSGLYCKVPFLQNVVFFDNRILTYDTRPAEALTSDKKTIVLDNYASWRITNPLLFYQTLRTVHAAQTRLDDVIYSQLRIAVGSHSLTDVITTQRTEIMDTVTRSANTALQDFGVSIIDVRIKRTDFPKENQAAIFRRMRSERERQAQQYRSEGQEEALRIRSTTDKERAIILANANSTATILRGEAEAESAAIYAKAFSQDPSFFAFKRSLDAYQEAFAQNTTFILKTNNPFLQYLNVK